MENLLSMVKYMLPITLILGSFIIGIIFEKRGLITLKKITGKIGWQGTDIIVKSLRGVILLWFSLGGLSLAVVSLPIKASFLIIIQKVLLVIFLTSVTLVISRLAIGFIKFFSGRGEESPQLTSLFENLTRILIFILGSLIIIQSLGIAITPLLTALGIGGVSIGLALQSTFANLFSSINILTAKKLRPGDYIELKTGEAGYVKDITWKHTVIEEITENWLIVPNSKIVSASFKNYSFPSKNLLINVEVGVAYDSDLEQVERVTLEVARETITNITGGVPESNPFIRYYQFDYFRINFIVYIRIQEFYDSLLIRHEFIKRLHQRYRQENIAIPLAVPINYLPKSQ
ncbi:MAG: mechanosensitive ion channel, partial [Xenococcaceae cyanobacterium MO_167.B27]|nr:mechanosensitive ion channel [Xenococcaceae cyanobacterium MO_167.B27]